jgi:hypothetical protein
MADCLDVFWMDWKEETILDDKESFYMKKNPRNLVKMEDGMEMNLLL